MQLIDLRPKRVGADLRGVCQLSSNVNQYPTVLEDGNTVAWYDYTATDTITKDGSNFVSRWNDKLGSGHDLIQATGTNQPLLTSDGVLFDGIDNYLKTSGFTFNQPEFIYLVINAKSWTLLDYLLDGNTTNSGFIQQVFSSPSVYAYAGSQSGYIKMTVNQYHIIRTQFNADSSKLIINNEPPLTGNFGSLNMGGFTLATRGGAGDRYANIEVKEVILRKVADSLTNETDIYNYLKTKYSL